MQTPEPRKYERHELLHLADSPLCKKPDSLPPPEDWMGPQVTNSRPQTVRSRTDGDANGNEDGPRSLSSARRPSFFEARLSRSSIPEDIVLGPPKISFASSSARTPGKFDHNTLNSPVFDDERNDSPRFDRFKFTRGGGDDKDKETPRDFSDLRGNKRGGRDDSDGWTNVSRPPRKSFGAEDGDRFSIRRDTRGDGEKKGGTPWDRDRPAKYENFGKERERDHRGRGKRDESSWILEDRGDRTRDNHRDNHRFSGRVEKDPEWLDSGPDNNKDTKSTHSMEEFQKWKERMKANATQDQTKKKPEESITKSAKQPEIFEDEVEEESKKEEIPNKEDSDEGVQISKENSDDSASEPQPVENGVDRFFGFWSGGNVLRSPEQTDILAAPPKAPGKSRFTSFFTPEESSPAISMQSQYQSQLQQQQLQQHHQQQQHQQAQHHAQGHQLPHQLHNHSMPNHSMPKELSQTPPYTNSPANDSNSEDREGFQRILQMLGETSIRQSDPGAMSAPLLSRPVQSSVSPAASGFTSPHPPPTQQNSRDPNADFLMRLMQQSQQQQQSQQHQQQQQQQSHMHGPPMHNKYGPSQMPPPPPIDTSAPSFTRGNGPHGPNGPNGPNNPMSTGLDDPAVMYGRQRPSQESSPTLPRGPPTIMDHHGPPPGWNPQSHMTSQAPPPQSHRQIAPPPGFARVQHQQGPPPPPPFLGPAPPGPLPFGVLNGPVPNIPLQHQHHPFMGMNGMNGMNGINGMNGMNGGPLPPGPHMNGPPPPGGYPLPFPPHHDLMLGGMHGGPPFGFPHPEGLKSPPFGHGPPGKGILR